MGLLLVQSCGRELTYSGTPFDIHSQNGADLDLDNIADLEDNCPTVYNPNQVDSNYDGLGDACTPAAELSDPLLSIVEEQSSLQSILLTWTNNNSNVSYILKRKINDNSYAVVGEFDGQTHEFTDYNLVPGQSYTYRIEVHREGNFRLSNRVEFEVSNSGDLLFTPQTPSNLSVDFIYVGDECYPRFHWYDNSDDELAFALFGSVLTMSAINYSDEIWETYQTNAQEMTSTGWRSYTFIGNIPLVVNEDISNIITMEIAACNSDGCSDTSPTLRVENGSCQ
ncbi:fibronectin type III domain-containing protein [bacterium]|nr:fibronectin type III domain-containing protein [bacterium]